MSLAPAHNYTTPPAGQILLSHGLLLLDNARIGVMLHRSNILRAPSIILQASVPPSPSPLSSLLSRVKKVQEEQAEGGADHEPSVEQSEGTPPLHRLLQVLAPPDELVVDGDGSIEHVLHSALLLHDLVGKQAHESRNLGQEGRKWSACEDQGGGGGERVLMNICRKKYIAWITRMPRFIVWVWVRGSLSITEANI